jgi:hypothetical protein
MKKIFPHQKATIPGEIAIRDKNWHQRVISLRNTPLTCCTGFAIGCKK